MQFPLHVKDFEELAGLNSKLHLAIGMFDGVHLGHRAVIESAVFSARRSRGISGVLTFDPHPSRLFRPTAPTHLLMPVESRLAILDSLGVDLAICKQFDRAFASITANDFLPELKAALPSLKSVYVGENFRFGKQRKGSVTTLIESGKQFDIGVFSAERIKHNGKPISSTRIRNELESGNIEVVNDLLGCNYFSIGTITRGKQLGRQIGFPTLNVPWSPECLPRFGVYQVRFRSAPQSNWQYGIANYGVKPTVASEEQSPLLEVHAFETTPLDQGDWIEVQWLRFIRPEKKFESIDALKAQITRDCETARNFSEYA